MKETPEGLTQQAQGQEAYAIGRDAGRATSQDLIDNGTPWSNAAHLEALTLEAEEHARQYHPFEITAHQFNAAPWPTKIWEAYESGVRTGSSLTALKNTPNPEDIDRTEQLPENTITLHSRNAIRKTLHAHKIANRDQWETLHIIPMPQSPGSPQGIYREQHIYGTQHHHPTVAEPIITYAQADKPGTYQPTLTDAIHAMADEHGNLRAYAWPGGYPIAYYLHDNTALCSDCANHGDDRADIQAAEAITVPGDPAYPETCDDCGRRFEDE